MLSDFFNYNYTPKEVMGWRLLILPMVSQGRLRLLCDTKIQEVINYLQATNGFIHLYYQDLISYSQATNAFMHLYYHYLCRYGGCG